MDSTLDFHEKKKSYFGSNSIEILARCPISSNNLPCVKQQQQKKLITLWQKDIWIPKKKEEEKKPNISERKETN